MSALPIASPRMAVATQPLIVAQKTNLGSVLPDRDGIIRKFPLAVLGAKSTNRTNYEPSSALKVMSDINAPFGRAIAMHGGREGEYGHPIISLQVKTPDERAKAVARMLDIDRNRVSHRIMSIETATSNDGTVVVYGDIMPSGPFRQHLLDDLANPLTNVGFSLRCHSVPSQVQPGMLAINYLVTFDCVSIGGFDHASKLGYITTEHFAGHLLPGISCPIFLADLMRPSTMAAMHMEHLSPELVAASAGASEVVINGVRVGIYDPDQGSILRSDGSRMSLFRAMFSEQDDV